jgi:hypothetical protein
MTVWLAVFRIDSGLAWLLLTTIRPKLTGRNEVRNIRRGAKLPEKRAWHQSLKGHGNDADSSLTGGAECLGA